MLRLVVIVATLSWIALPRANAMAAARCGDDAKSSTAARQADEQTGQRASKLTDSAFATEQPESQIVESAACDRTDYESPYWVDSAGAEPAPIPSFDFRQGREAGCHFAPELFGVFFPSACGVRHRQPGAIDDDLGTFRAGSDATSRTKKQAVTAHADYLQRDQFTLIQESNREKRGAADFGFAKNYFVSSAVSPAGPREVILQTAKPDADFAPAEVPGARIERPPRSVAFDN